MTSAGKSQGTGCWQNWLFFRFFSRYCIRRSSQKASGTRCPVWYFQTQLPLGLLTLMEALCTWEAPEGPEGPHCQSLMWD